MKRTLPGEIWRVDFGLAAKVRPALILSDYPQDDELTLLVVIPHQTGQRNLDSLVEPWPLKRPVSTPMARRLVTGPSTTAPAATR